MSARRLLVIGREGQVAHALREAGASRDLTVEAMGRTQIAAAGPHALETAIIAGPWIAVVNAAAYTAVDRAESEPEAAFAVNCYLPAALARACASAGLPLIHLSTDYVFDGSKREAYTEDDHIAPMNVYGASKAAGEDVIRSIWPRHVIIRTSWVFSETGQNFVKTMLRLAQTRDEIGVVDDQRGRPTAAADLAETILAIAAALAAGKRDGFGIFHYAGKGATTWHDFAKAIFASAAARGLCRVPRLRRIATSDYPTAARRPLNSVLATERLTAIYGVIAPPWTQGLDAAVELLSVIRNKT
jgi:dTDP-4-dehydrorhamnose reductase